MLKPHLSRYWLNANPQNPETFKQQSNQICQLYQQAQELNSNNIHIISTDEMTGIQADERTYSNPESSMKKREFKDRIVIAVVKVPSLGNKSSERFHPK